MKYISPRDNKEIIVSASYRLAYDLSNETSEWKKSSNIVKRMVARPVHWIVKRVGKHVMIPLAKALAMIVPNRKGKIVMERTDIYNVDVVLAKVIHDVMSKFKSHDRRLSPELDEDDSDLDYEGVLDEIIWTFKQLSEPFDDRFITYDGTISMEEASQYLPDDYKGGIRAMTVSSNDEERITIMFGLESEPKRYRIDIKAFNEYNARIKRGKELFQKYFTTFWT